MAWLVFVDTNILLDFYRLSGGSAARQLGALERHKNLLITSDQVRMEFLKNRQNVITASLREITKPLRPGRPSVLAEYEPARMLDKRIGEALTQHEKVKKKIERILRNPSRNDPVYQSLTRIFDHKGPYNLVRPDKTRLRVRRLAQKRFNLGYPPRKDRDTSIGDAINWEWTIECALKSPENHDILIVSRDADYGTTYAKETMLNDWLRREFKERVSRRRKIELTNKLTYALGKLDEDVSSEDESEEKRILEESLASDWNFLLERIRSYEEMDLVKLRLPITATGRAEDD